MILLPYLKIGELHDVTPVIKIKQFIAPIAKNDVVGSISYSINGISYSSDLLASHDVYSSNYMYFVFALVAILIVLTLLFVLIYRKLGH